MFHYLSEGKRRGWDGSCCAKGQKKARPERKGEVLYGECKNFKYNGGSITAKGLKYSDQSISMRLGFKDKGRGDVTPHCTGIFKCDGDLLWCPAKACPMTGADKARQGRPGQYTYSSSSSDDDGCDNSDYGKKKKKKKKKKRRYLRRLEIADEAGENNEEGKTNQRRLFTSRSKFVNKIDENGDENDEGEKNSEEKPVGFWGRMLGKKKKKKGGKKKSKVFGTSSYRPGAGYSHGKDRMSSSGKPSSKGYSNGGRNSYGASSRKCKKGKKKEENGPCTSTCRCGDVTKIDKNVFKSLGNINKMRKMYDL